MTDTKIERFGILPENEPISWKIWKKKRYIVAFMVFLGLVSTAGIRTLMSIAVVSMTEVKTHTDADGNIIQEQEFDWDSKEKGLLLSALFYGYVCTMSIGGYLACKFGGVLTLTLGILSTSIFTFITPFFGNFGFEAFITLRILVGLSEGTAYISSYDVFAQWAPPDERTIMVSISAVGIQCGNILGMFISGILAQNFGWRSIFYFFGGYGFIWCIISAIFIRNNPLKDKYISEDEKRYISESLKNINEQKNQPIPWKHIFTSIPFYSYVVASVAETWGFFTLVTSLPLFFDDTMHVNIQNSGILSAAPFICMAIVLPLSARLADYFITKERLTTTQTRCYYTLISFFVQGIFLILVAHIPSPTWIIVCMITSVGFGAFAFSGYYLAPLEMAPQYASVISGLGQTISISTGIISPTLTGFIVQNKAAEEWHIVFYITSAIFIFGGLVFFFFGSSELQPWAKSSNEKCDK